MEHPNQPHINLKDILQKLNHTELNNFKSVLRDCPLPDAMNYIPKVTLNLANGVQLAEILTEYCPTGWMERLTLQILKEIDREDLAEIVAIQLERAISDSPLLQKKNLQGAEKQEHKHKKSWLDKYKGEWKYNFWPTCNENLYIETESYRTLVTLCNPKARMPFAHVIVLHGPPRSGKTTVAKRLMLQWSESKQAQMFPCAFYISCGALNETRPCTFIQLLTMENPSWRKFVIMSLVMEENFLFVVDGLDELKFPAEILMHDICEDWNKEKPAVVLLSSLLQRKMAPHATLLVTTRTQALRQIYLIIDQPFLVEIQAFSEQERQKYFQIFFKEQDSGDDGAQQGGGDTTESDDQRALRAFNALRGNATLFHMASLPSACSIFCVCLDQGMRKRKDLALTCQTHTSMFLNFLFRVFSPETYESYLKTQIQSTFRKLCILAADTLLEQLPVVCEEDLFRLEVNLNYLHFFECRNIIDRKEKSNCYNFFHLSVQQLMAAIIFVQELEKEDSDVSKYSMQKLLSRETRLKNPNLSGVLLFVFGLLNETRLQKLRTYFDFQISIGVKRKLLEYKSEKNEPLSLLIDRQEILSCLYESQDKGLVKEVMAIFEEMSLDLKTSTDLICASFCLKNSQNLHTVSLQVAKGIFPENDAMLESTAQCQSSQNNQHLLAFWTDFCDLFNSNKKLVFLDISKSFLSISSMKILCDKLSSAPCRLKKVLLKDISPADAFKKLCLVFNGYETLSHLTLKGDNLSTILPLLCEVMKHPACNLKFLSLCSYPTGIQKWDDFFQAIKVRQSLTCLDLTDNELLDKGARLLCKTWKQPNSTLQRVSLENCNLTEACCKDISSILMVSQTLTHLNLAKNILGDNGVKVLCESLSYPECKLKTLVLWSCNITSEGCRHLSKMLSQASSLEHLDLGQNCIRTLGTRILCEALKELQSNLKSLWLCGCFMTPNNCKDISETLRKNKSLNTLDLSQNNLGTDAVKTFCEDLKCNVCPLQTLRLKFDVNPGIQRLIQEMKNSHPQLTINNDRSDLKGKGSPLPHFIF
ncbi:NACHT, LRR and PYD domains-containing protein 2 [Onychomys torridus]|uniref:NACHT, LRR and PYD domains-containing protein 2 n=1 Tax=Onychomys torridus TaxID=38674 RepID=UPI00167F4DB2|nr:NACHT, LRR and PYD domains-containing protein 2 [Onychomys torridus]